MNWLFYPPQLPLFLKCFLLNGLGYSLDLTIKNCLCVSSEATVPFLDVTWSMSNKHGPWVPKTEHRAVKRDSKIQRQVNANINIEP